MSLERENRSIFSVPINEFFLYFTYHELLIIVRRHEIGSETKLSSKSCASEETVRWTVTSNRMQPIFHLKLLTV